MAINETVRAELSALEETWGEREALTPRIRQCRGDGWPASHVTLMDRIAVARLFLTDSAGKAFTSFLQSCQ
ncbi:hypothetical protein [Streptomyces sp. NPDC046821]|uniref:hypothetical protein n=1 Tax=Streptomyces sp. NPDC046821 TaxID=3154702 RepID=UPI0033C29C2B